MNVSLRGESRLITAAENDALDRRGYNLRPCFHELNHTWP